MKVTNAIVLFVGSFSLVACGSGDETRSFKLVPVSGTVTLNGKPLAGATVVFAPEAANKPSTPGSDTTGPEGNYKLMYRNRSGVAPGKYKVTVAMPLKTSGVVNESFKDDPYMAQLAAGGAAAPDKKKDKDE